MQLLLAPIEVPEGGVLSFKVFGRTVTIDGPTKVSLLPDVTDVTLMTFACEPTMTFEVGVMPTEEPK